MAYAFTEDILLQVPNLDDKQINEFVEAETKTNKGIVVEVAALHAGATNNHNFYPEESLAESVDSWTSPYPRPVLINHDPHSEPLGRVMAAKMDKESDGTPYIRLQLAITDPSAMEKVLSKRYLTCSVGGKAEEALCSICGENWAKSSMFSPACKHVRGRTYKDKKAEIVMKGCNFKEISFVNMPADQRAGIRGVVNTDITEEEIPDDERVKNARIFELSMDEESIFEITESEKIDVLGSLKKKEAQPLYMQFKGAFLSALATEESEEEDILTATEDLTEQLEQISTAPWQPEQPDPDTTNPNVTPAPVAGRPQGQEKARRLDVDPERSTGAPMNRTSDDTEILTPEEASSDETELKVKDLELRVEELETQKANLEEENTRLKAALKRSLVERVVDTKIQLGMVAMEDRTAQIEEHLGRSANSLTDSLKDLLTMNPVKPRSPITEIPTVAENKKSVAAKGGPKEPTVGNISEMDPKPLTEKDIQEKVVTIFSDRLLGKRHI